MPGVFLGLSLNGDETQPAFKSVCRGRGLAAELGVDFGAPTLGYADRSGARATDVVDLDPTMSKIIVDWLELSDTALRRLDPDRTPILWPEHFDVAIELGGHTFGSSPGDDHHPTPYAYISTPTPTPARS